MDGQREWSVGVCTSYFVEVVLFSPRRPDQSGLFSAVVAAFLIFSIPLLQPSPIDATNELLTQISQQLSANGTGSAQPLSPADKSSFQPPASVVCVNILWLISLYMSLASALCATLMQQWAQRYTQMADRPYDPPKCARIRAFFADGAEKYWLAAAFGTLPSLLHSAAFLFSAGMVVFLININHLAAYLSLIMVVTGDLIYIILTIMPLFYPNWPYQTPLTLLCWIVMEATPLLVLWLRRQTVAVRTAIRERRTKIRQGFYQALELKAIELTSQADADISALRWTLNALYEDHKLEEFLDGLPGLFRAPLRHYSLKFRTELEQLVKPVADKLFVTCTTGLLSAEDRIRRLSACLGAIWCLPGTIDHHFWAILDQWDKKINDPWGPLSTETWAAASDMTTDLDHFIAFHAHCIQALMAIMWIKGRWQDSEATSLLQRQLGVSVDIDRWRHSSRGDQLQLAVAANLLTNSLPLLHKLDEVETGTDATLKMRLKAILDTICGELDASEVPHGLRALFADGAEVMKVFGIQDAAAWSKIFTHIHTD